MLTNPAFNVYRIFDTVRSHYRFARPSETSADTSA